MDLFGRGTEKSESDQNSESIHSSGFPEVRVGRDDSLLYLRDTLTKRDFLCDTGAHASMVPALPSERARARDSNMASTLPHILNVSGGTVRLYGKRRMSVCFGGRTFHWDFITADTSFYILGADFLAAYGLLVDLRNQRLIDSDTGNVFPQARARSAQLASSAPVAPDVFSVLLDEFPGLCTADFSSPSVRHGVEHHVVTTGPPVHARARRLDPAKLAVAKSEFAEMERMGVIRRSDSPWASPLHLVPKPNGSWRPCGDYRRLNGVTTDDRYPVPHIQDFNAHLAGTRIFSKIDLVRGYHQIPMQRTCPR